MKDDEAIVKSQSGGPHTKFDDFVTRNHRKFERKLVWFMISSQQPLNWVISQLVSGKILDAGNMPNNK